MIKKYNLTHYSSPDVVYLGIPQKTRSNTLNPARSVYLDIRSLDPNKLTADEDAVDICFLATNYMKVVQKERRKDYIYQSAIMLLESYPDWFRTDENHSFDGTKNNPIEWPTLNWGRKKQTLGMWALRHREILSDPRMVAISLRCWKTVAYREDIPANLLLKSLPRNTSHNKNT